MEKMLQETAKFVLLVALLFLAFVIAFYALYAAPSSIVSLQASVANNYSIATNETNLLETYITSVYETFLLSFAGKSPDDVFFTRSSVPSLHVFLYCVSIFECAIVSLNLLVAVSRYQVEDV